MLPLPVRIPTATYRFQLRPEFGFDQARDLAPYLSRLGISEIYASPFFQASSSSARCTATTSTIRTNSVRRSGARKASSVSARRCTRRISGFSSISFPITWASMASTTGAGRTCWKTGRTHASRATSTSSGSRALDRLKDRVLVPILGAHYGAVLEKGRAGAKLREERAASSLALLPIRACRLRPRSYGVVLRGGHRSSSPADDERRARLAQPQRCLREFARRGHASSARFCCHKTRDRLR